MKKIVYVLNKAEFLLSHRLEISLAAKKSGSEVHVICSKSSSMRQLVDYGFHVHLIDFGRNRTNPFLELKVVFQLVTLFNNIKPDLVHLITIKPYLYGGIAARITGTQSVVSAVAGLGIVFSSNQLRYRLLRVVLYPLFKFAFSHENQNVIFQNADDRDTLVSWGVIKEDKVRIIRGSGVDLSTCPVVEEPEGTPIVSFAGRLLKDKGVEVFVEASRILKKRHVEARFWLIGDPDLGNSNTVTHEELNQWQAEELVECLGFRADIASLFAQSNIVTLPSFYGEGLPKVLIEAAACSRAVITTDHPGCRDAIAPDQSGVLIPVKDPIALADMIQYLIENPDKRKVMGRSGRDLAEKVFDVKKVVDEHLKIYQRLMK